TGYQLAVTVYDGTNIYNLDSSEFTVDVVNHTVTLTNLARATGDHSVTVTLTVALPAMHADGEPIFYTGGPNDVIVAGQPILDSQGRLQHDSNGNLIVYSASQ